MKVYERLASAFRAEGASHAFGMMGDGNMHWMLAFEKLGGKVMEVRHEGAGLGMADGWARVTRTPGIATATCGPGVSQLASALLTASRARSPLVAFVGEHPTNDEEHHQYLNQGPFAAACETGFLRLNTADGADEAVRKAFYLARLECRPIMLSAPLDIQQQQFEDDGPYVPSTSILPQRTIPPDVNALAQAAEMIANSSKPVVLVGRGAMWSGAGNAVIKLAARIGALITTSLLAKTWLSEDAFHVGVSGQYATRTAIKLFAEADCVIAVGASLNRHTISHGYQFPAARYVQIDIQPHVMIGHGSGADCYLQSDAGLAIEALDNLLALQSYRSTGYRTDAVREQLANAWEDRTPFEIEPGSVDPRHVIVALDELLPANISLNTGSGATASFSNILFKRARPRVLAGHFYGCIGQALPAAMGAVIAMNNRPLVLVDGDAGIMMHLAEFETAVRYDMPLLVVVMNNQMLGVEYYKLDAQKLKADGAFVNTPNMGALAQACGGRGALARSVEEVRHAVTAWLTKPGPMMIDVRISRNVIPLPFRRMHYGIDE